MYCGLDISLKETFVTIINDSGDVINESVVFTDVDSISHHLHSFKHRYKKIGIESGQLSIYLCKNLRKAGFDSVICVDARHMSKFLSSNINKNDKNDALGIAQMMRANLYKEVQIKSDSSCEMKMILGSRRQLVNSRKQLMGTLRGLLKIYGIKLPLRCNSKVVLSAITKDFSQVNNVSVISLINAIDAISMSLCTIDAELKLLCSNDEDCKLLQTIPSVGEITAATYKSSLDVIDRFSSSRSVGAYIGLTPRQYSSGEVNRHGSISKMGSKECRSMLYEAAQSLLIVSKKNSRLKSWGKKIAKKKGNKKAIVALARKLSVIMHRMLIERKAFIAN